MRWCRAIQPTSSSSIPFQPLGDQEPALRVPPEPGEEMILLSSSTRVETRRVRNSRQTGAAMDGKAPETTRRTMPLPPGRKRHSPRMSRVTFDPDADGRLLALIRNATFISHRQLLELAMRAHIKATTSAIRQRIGRFLEYDLIQVVPARTIHTGAVYQITRWGLSALESFGLGIHSISSETERLPSVFQAPHFLDLNAVRIAFLRTQLLSKCEWITACGRLTVLRWYMWDQSPSDSQ